MAELAKTGKPGEARAAMIETAQAYMDLVADMPERVSFASTAAMKGAKVYEDLGRLLMAMQVYAFTLSNYGLTLSQKDCDDILKKVEAWEAIYKDPFKHIAGQMDEVKKNLAATDSGKQTQAKEGEIVMVLEDLIKTEEEKQKGGGQGKPDNKGKKPGEDQDPSTSSSPGGKKPGGTKPGPPSGTNKPSSPAQLSAVVPGAVQRPEKFADPRTMTGSGEWSELPPRERERLLLVMKKMLSERSRDLSSEYFSEIAKDLRNGGARNDANSR